MSTVDASVAVMRTCRYCFHVAATTWFEHLVTVATIHQILQVMDVSQSALRTLAITVHDTSADIPVKLYVLPVQ